MIKCQTYHTSNLGDDIVILTYSPFHLVLFPFFLLTFHANILYIFRRKIRSRVDDKLSWINIYFH